MPLSLEQRSTILKETYSWLGTPYRGWSCMKHCGVDCGQLLYGIFYNCGHLPEIVLPRDYSLQISQHRASTAYVDLIAQYMREISESEALPADVVVYQLGKAFAHAGVIISWPEHIIHALGNHHGVCGSHGNNNPIFRRMPRRFFTVRDEWC